MIIKIPTINDVYDDFATINNILRKYHDVKNKNIILDFSQCYFLQPNGIVFLAGLLSILNNNNRVTYNRNTANPDVRKYLAKQGFLDVPSVSYSDYVIPLRNDIEIDKEEISRYFCEKCFSLTKLQDELSSAVMSSIWEIYDNVATHSDSKVGVFTCGQYYPKKAEIKISIADFGVGIPNHIKQHVDSFRNKLDKCCLEWSFGDGNTTTNTARGIGLEFLKKFVKKNQGFMEVYSNESYALFRNGSELFLKSNFNFFGTFYSICIKTDTSYFFTKEEQFSCF